MCSCVSGPLCPRQGHAIMPSSSIEAILRPIEGVIEYRRYRLSHGRHVSLLSILGRPAEAGLGPRSGGDLITEYCSSAHSQADH